MSKNLYDNFRETGSNIRRQPSERAWKRLENRLDGSQGVQRTLRTRWWIMAASVLLLVGITAGIILSSEKESSLTAAAESTGQFVSEDLVYTDTKVENIPAVRLQNRIESQTWQPVNEGKSGQRLIAVHVNKSPRHAAQPASQDVIAATESAVAVTADTTVPTRQSHGGARHPFADYLWLEGSWQTQNDIREEWQMHGGYELTNAGSMTDSRAMPFIFGLQCYSQMCDLKMVTDATGATETYELSDKTADEFEFWSTGKAYPETVIIRRVNKNEFVLNIAGSKVSAAQQKYLTANGFVFAGDGSARRVMKRR